MSSSGVRRAGGGSLTVMLEEHSELRAAIAQMKVALSSRDKHAVHQVRWRLSFLVARHVSVEDSHIYPILAQDTRPHVATIVARFTGKIGELKTRAASWRTSWGAERLSDDWEGFTTDTLSLLGEIESRMVMEERDLFPLILDAERAGLGAT